MKNTRILLVEADDGFANQVNSILSRMGITSTVIARDYSQAWKSFLRSPPDICLLEVGTSEDGAEGVDFARQVRRENDSVKFIFLAAHFTEENYLKAKTVDPVSFMNRDLSFLKIKEAIERAIPPTPEKSPLLTPADQGPRIPPQIEGNSFFFKIGDVYKAIPVKEVRYFFADNKMTFAKIGRRNYPTNVQLKVLEKNLGPVFIRCHKKYLVNQAWITSINVKEDKIDLQGDVLPIGYAYRKDFLGRLNLLK